MECVEFEWSACKYLNFEVLLILKQSGLYKKENMKESTNYWKEKK